MFSFLIGRIFHGLLTLLIVVVLISSIIYLAPVDPAGLTFGQRSDVETIEKKKKELGLDQSLPKQLLLYFRDISPLSVVQADKLQGKPYTGTSLFKASKEKVFALKYPYFRSSYQTGNEVATMMKKAIPKTILLALSAFIIAVIIGILLGIIAALNKDTWIDKCIVSLSVIGYSVPSYVSAIVLALIFGYWLQSITGLNIQGSIVELNDLGDEVIVWKNLLLPAMALGIRPLAVIAQLTRSAFLDVLSEDFIRTAKAKGLNFRNILKFHAFRNSMNPVVTAVSGWMASLLAGAFFVENVFNFKGLGQMTVTALLNYDIPVILACVIFTCTVFIFINVLVDVAYKLLDPRIKFG
jgi:peptide/nickel transport system permease protein